MTDNCETTIVIFGASGDLTWRKLIPALYNNFKKERLSDCTNIVGFARRPYTDETLREHLLEGVKEFSAETFDRAVWKKFAERIHYFQGDLDKDNDLTKLDAYAKSLEDGPANRLYYLATAPELYVPAVEALGAAGMAKEDNKTWRRIIIEKPFGHDLQSARELNRHTHDVFDESQVYRIDHYLGKETSQN